MFSTSSTPSEPSIAGNDKRTSTSMPCFPNAGTLRGNTWRSSRRMHFAMFVTVKPSAQLVYPFLWMIRPAAFTTSAWMFFKPSSALSVPIPGCTSIRRTPPTVHCDQTATDESPCSPSTMPCTLPESTSRYSASSARNREVSSAVPVPITLFGANPEMCVATCVMTSQGLVRISRTASGDAAAMGGTMDSKIATLRATKSSLDSPSR
mmetsp:Transcript_14765/g.63422  ORF Transcript_14765/g.63422 Transcript_14765/m.63422 type:complete len:207 (+) Transcript_14765:139-759(+)